MISPTVGRKLWFIPSLADITVHGYKTLPDPIDPTSTQPLDATVIAVHDIITVNVLIVDVEGNLYHQDSCLLVQDDKTIIAPNESYCEWMPYQITQAAIAATPVLAITPVTGTVA